MLSAAIEECSIEMTNLLQKKASTEHYTEIKDLIRQNHQILTTNQQMLKSLLLVPKWLLPLHVPIHVLYLDCCVDIVTVSYYISEEVGSADTDVSGNDDEHHCGPDDLWTPLPARLLVYQGFNFEICLHFGCHSISVVQSHLVFPIDIICFDCSYCVHCTLY